MAVAAMARAVPKLCYAYSWNHKVLWEPTNFMGSHKFFLNAPKLLSIATVKEYSPIHASNSPREEENSSIDNSNTISQDEDLNYLWKLGAGSVAGAALIKYGSILFPEITKPNILLALTMVLTPVVVSIVILFKQSRTK